LALFQPTDFRVILEQGVNKWRHSTAAADDDQHANQQQHDDDGHQPPFFTLFHKAPEVSQKIHVQINFSDDNNLLACYPGNQAAGIDLFLKIVKLRHLV
jgi:hypothetical protein